MDDAPRARAPDARPQPAGAADPAGAAFRAARQPLAPAARAAPGSAEATDSAVLGATRVEPAAVSHATQARLARPSRPAGASNPAAGPAARAARAGSPAGATGPRPGRAAPARLLGELDALRRPQPLGRVGAIAQGLVEVTGLGGRARLGDRLLLRPRGGGGRGREERARGGAVACEVVRVGGDAVLALAEGDLSPVAVGDPAQAVGPARLSPHEGWIGRILDPDGHPLDGRPLTPGRRARALLAAPPAPAARRALGPRLATGLAAFDTLLPLARGQRVGLFAGAGVGKSMLLADLARGVAADVVVLALVGERGRELRAFVEGALGPQGMARAVVVAATSDRAAAVRRRCAWSAMAVAEHFRDEGRQVLLLVDSVTRFAEAQREVALAAGEAASLRGHPPSMAPALAQLAERAGPGSEGMGDITAILSVLVAGGDMDEPVADTLRGLLDGHVVLERAIAEAGRFPAIDALRSVSRSLPGAATEAQNALIARARRLLGAYERSALMVRSGLYTPGADPTLDTAVALEPALDAFLAERAESPEAAFARLAAILEGR